MKSTTRFIAGITIALAGMVVLMGFSVENPTLHIGFFSSPASTTLNQDGWLPLSLGKRTRDTEYDLVNEDGMQVVRAVSRKSASGLVKRLDVEPAMYPQLQWQWKVENTLAEGDLFSKGGDDFAARVSVSFAYDVRKLPLGERLKYRALRMLGHKNIPLRTISYVWANKAHVGTEASNAHTNWVKMIVVQSGDERINSWQLESRDVYEDYKRVFGDAPGAITGISLMTDSDDTMSSATAFFGDIVLQRRN